MRIAIILATRGLVFTEVEEAIETLRHTYVNYTEPIKIRVFRSYNLVLPESQNFLTQVALESFDPDYLFFIEEDTVPPLSALTRLLKAKSDIACIDYGVNGYSCTARERKTNELLWCGLGCTLIKKEVFNKLEYPWFRSDQSLRLNDWKWVPNTNPYGGQDIWFCMQAREKGFTIKQIEGEAKHLRLDSLGKPETNKGLHQISQKPVITKQQVIDIPEEHDWYFTINRKSDTVKSIGNLPTSTL